jgi:hypothetical protein
LHHDGFAAAPAVAPAELRRDLAGAAPVLLLHAPRPPLAWRAAPARAPPSRA